ncbi:ribokinase [Sphingomonas bacterium]|uniref:ribokinase n=1 Tax=Sphingomonas bacterium TaxID=1895847 RepID=UPI0015771481|nr:ribokinase [Sphingomonas bacterium]
MTIVVLGGINQDVVAAVDDLPRCGETVAATGVTHRAGGKGLNQAIAAVRHGGAVRLLGAVGDDPAGAGLREVMAGESIDAGDVAVLADRPTGQALIALARSGANTIIVNAGANAAFKAAEVARARTDADVFLTQFEATPEAIEALFTTRHAERGIRILNAAPAIEAGHPLLALVDILVLNETELQMFARLPDVPDREADIVDHARGLLSRPDQHVIVTLGASGCLCVGQDRSVRVPGLRMDAIDTIGAGDCFCGVLAAALDRGALLEDALHSANAAAAISVTREGAGASAPSRAEVDEILARAHVGGGTR